MAYHLLDNTRRHLAMSDSLADLEAVATDMLMQQGRPFGYIRWTEASGEQKEVCVSPESLAARVDERAMAFQQSQAVRQVAAQRKTHRRATQLTNSIVALLLLYIVGEITSIILQMPFVSLFTGP